MKNKPWLILDCPFLCWRAYYSQVRLPRDDPRELLYRFFRELQNLQKRFFTEKVAFCFDLGKSKRSLIYPEYKKKNNPPTEEEKEVRRNVNKQIETLRTEYLPELRYRNNFFQTGYEADDCIASIVQNNKSKFIIVSSDQDLYQLISDDISVWNPIRKKLLTKRFFIKKYKGLLPIRWARIKARAGCKSDNIKGIPRIGPVTAMKYELGTLKHHYKTFNIIKKDTDILRKNLPLVKLPFDGTRKMFLREESPPSPAKWNELMDYFLGMRSLV